MKKSKTPTLDRMVEIQEQSQLCGEFLDWFLGKYTVFDRLLAEFFGIDLDEAEREKDILLQIEQNKHKTHHCKLCGNYIEEDNLSVCDKCASEYQI